MIIIIETHILRIGHRHDRDQRVTTHVGLTGRALGAKGMYLAADDRGVVESIRSVARRFGGDYHIEDGVQWRQCIHEFQESGGTVVHLTMYGLRIQDVIGDIRAASKILVIVGAEKVPGEIYGLADYNVGVTNQPHSEIAGLAVFLDQLYEGKELECEFPDADIRVIPCERGKNTVEL